MVHKLNICLQLVENQRNVFQITILIGFIFATAFGNTERLCGKNEVLKGSECVCEENRIGENCEEFACDHGMSVGSRYDKNSIYYNKKCICDGGWGGEMCDRSTIDRCNGRGENMKSGCLCRDNYIGHKCQFVKQCANGQLSNGICTCYYGWRGDFCDTIVCSHGYPDKDSGSTSCICPRTHRGRFCDFCTDENANYPDCDIITNPQTNQSSGIFTSISQFSLLFWIVLAAAVLIIIALIIYQKRRSTLRNASKKTSIHEKNETEKDDLLIKEMKTKQ